MIILFCYFSSEKAYRLLFAEMSSWVRRKTPAAECTGKTGPSGNEKSLPKSPVKNAILKHD